MEPTEEVVVEEVTDTAPDAAPAEDAGGEDTPEVQDGGDAEADAPKGVDIFGEDAPASISAYDKNEDDFSISATDLEGLDPQAMHVLSNFRRAFHRKMEGVAASRKEVDTLRSGMDTQMKEIEQAKADLIEGRSKLIALFGDERLQEAAKPPELPEGGKPPDRWTEDGQAYYMKKAFAEEMSKVLDQWTSLSEEETGKIEQAKTDLAQASRVQELRSFVESHEDFAEMKDEIMELRKESGYHLSAERAYEIVASMRAKQVKVDEVAEARRDARRRVARPSMAGRRVVELTPPQDVIDRGGAAVSEWYAAHPESSAELFRRIQQGGA